MKIVSLTLTLGVFLLLPLANANATPDDDRFQKLATDYIEQYLQTHPEEATELGDHRFDDRLTDYSAGDAGQGISRSQSISRKTK